MQSTTDKKKVKQIFKTNKDHITCPKLMINELVGSPTRSENVYFAQQWTSIDCSLYCWTLQSFTHAEHDLIKLKLYDNWSAQAVSSVLCGIQRNQSNLLTFKN